MKTWLVVILCFALLPLSTAFAQQPDAAATKEDVQQMFDLLHTREQFNAVLTVMKQQVPAMSAAALKKQSPNATPEEIAQMNAFTTTMVEKMFQNMPFDEMMQAMMPAYQHHFTHAEIQELIQFYSSTLGKKIIGEMPALMAESMQAATPIMQKWMESQMVEMQASAEQYAKTLKEKKSPTAPKR